MQATISVDASSVVGRIATHIYGHFIENVARCIYGGILRNLRPGRPTGPWVEREQVLEWARELRPPVIRWPGGLYADGYNWRCGIGPREQRPVTRNRYWSRFGPLVGLLDPHRFGTQELMGLAESLGAEAYVNLNLGTGTPEEAARWAEFLVADADTVGGGLRAACGRERPYRVRYWGLGNETYAWWALGHTTPERYGARYLEFREALRRVDPAACCVAVGADGSARPDWNRRLLAVVGNRLELLSFHVYLPGMDNVLGYWRHHLGDREGTYYALVGAPLELEERIRWMARSVDEALGEGNGIGLALDEWNPWSSPTQVRWPTYTLRDALFVCGAFHAMHRTCDRLVLANFAQLVNALGLMRAYGRRCYRTALYYPFLLYGRLAGPLRLATEWQCETYAAPRVGAIPARQGIPFLDCSATLSEERRQLVLFVINRHATRSLRAHLEVKGFAPSGMAALHRLGGPCPHARNDHRDDRVVAITTSQVESAAALADQDLPPHSVTAVVLHAGENHPVARR